MHASSARGQRIASTTLLNSGILDPPATTSAASSGGSGFYCASSWPCSSLRQIPWRPEKAILHRRLFEHDLRANAPRLSRGKTGTHLSGRSSRACFSGSCSRPSPRSAQHVVFLEPGLHLVPSILGGFLAVTRA